ncbi:hypothetical protein TcasGA2_TC005700 [Tribolium castaneum]|uniref:Uncharacterized protein n=1 Tax=Tribolium castaneum TaxID=7070 RepID=D6WWQ6_TRICA|nr:hypothetical protein TcasGA2_TC005700 [Tribolium castaneum]
MTPQDRTQELIRQVNNLVAFLDLDDKEEDISGRLSSSISPSFRGRREEKTGS